MFHIVSLLPLAYITVLSGPINMLPCILLEYLVILKGKVKNVQSLKKKGMKSSCNLKAPKNSA